MEYCTVTQNKLIDDEVNQLIKDGWKPLGGISTINIDGKFWMSQALTYTKPVKRKVFKKPSLEELQGYITKNKYSVDAQKWLDHHIRVGWVVGRNKTPMKDWKATVRTWNYTTNDNKKPLNIPPKEWEPEKNAGRKLNQDEINEMKKRLGK